MQNGLSRYLVQGFCSSSIRTVSHILIPYVWLEYFFTENHILDGMTSRQGMGFSKPLPPMGLQKPILLDITLNLHGMIAK